MGVANYHPHLEALVSTSIAVALYRARGTASQTARSGNKSIITDLKDYTVCV